MAPTLVAAAAVGRSSASFAEADAGAGQAHAKSAPVGGAPPSDTESDRSGRTRAPEKRAANYRWGAMPRPTLSDVGGRDGGEDSEWNQSSCGSVLSCSSGDTPTPRRQGRRISGVPRREGGGGQDAKKKGPRNGKGNMWTAAEQVELCLAFKLVAQRADKGADWSKDDLWDNITADCDGGTPKSLQQGDLKG